ncbi:Uncharacterised protein [Stutzerimonas stutzeri]|nr:Uncharacterised protein [Stutzerimonas stutzeri]CAC9159159.1 Uncharacterised protein [Stutzerimonas stutzeri]CAD0188350.1 Hypothetical_protein [Stutzerimonas stutzeri]
MAQRCVVTVSVRTIAGEEVPHDAAYAFLGDDLVDFDNASTLTLELAHQHGEGIELNGGVELVQDFTLDDGRLFWLWIANSHVTSPPW